MIFIDVGRVFRTEILFYQNFLSPEGSDKIIYLDIDGISAVYYKTWDR